jgi:hypothetical protein
MIDCRPQTIAAERETETQEYSAAESADVGNDIGARIGTEA